jgi:hypothetical protein
MEFYSAMKKNIMLFTGKHVELENFILKEKTILKERPHFPSDVEARLIS